MAVKQNNADGNGTSSSGTGSASSATSSSSSSTSTTSSTGTSQKKMNPKGGPPMNVSLNCSGSGNNSGSISSNTGIGIGSKDGKIYTVDYVLHLIDLVEQKQCNGELLSYSDRIMVSNKIIAILAKVSFPRASAEIKMFKEEISKVGTFFAKVNEEHKTKIYLQYLQIVRQLLTDDETPSIALAVIFQLFSDDMVNKAVKNLLSSNSHIQDETIKKIVKLLCDWLRGCQFCTNLNLWILTILNGLREQQKFDIIDDIAIEIIETLFSSLLFPAIRPKTAPVVFHILLTLKQTPEVFHKIVPRIPKLLHSLKQQASRQDDYHNETNKFIQNLVDLISALMANFSGYDEMYKSTVEALADFSPSYDYHSILNYPQNGSRDDIMPSDSNFMISANAKVGLINLGNTCYMNSVLQALAMTKGFSREILLSCSKSPLLIKMQQLIALMLHSLRSELNPSRVLSATRPPGFSPGLQQDSSEFLGYLLDTLHEQEMAFKQHRVKATSVTNIAHNNETFTSSSPSLSSSGQSSIKCDQRENNAMDVDADIDDHEHGGNGDAVGGAMCAIDSTDSTNSKQTAAAAANRKIAVCESASTAAAAAADTLIMMTTIEKTFMGKLATTYKCLTCGWQSKNVDSFRDLQLSFPEVKNDCASNYSVQDLIDYYCSPEKLYGDNQYFCEKCKKLSDAERFINVMSAPKNLILTLKHFKYDQKYHMRAKLMHKVFHDESVSVKVCSPDTLVEIASVHYDLYAAVVHSGVSMDSGHYYTYASDNTNKWYKFNDNIVSICKIGELHNLTPPNTPYILFYQMAGKTSETQLTATATNSLAQIDTINGGNRIKIEIPISPTMEELSPELRDYICRENCMFNEEIKTRKIKLAAAAAAAAAAQNAAIKSNTSRHRGHDDDDDDDDQPPPTSGCGGNVMNFNYNRFVY